MLVWVCLGAAALQQHGAWKVLMASLASCFRTFPARAGFQGEKQLAT